VITCTVFDLDDTLYPEVDYAVSGLTVVGRHLERVHELEGVTQRLIENMRRGERKGILDRIVATLGVEHPVEELVSLYREHAPTISLHEDALPAIEQARAQGPVCLLTDGLLPGQQAKVKALGIAGYFEHIIYTDALGREHWKPSPLGFEELERRVSAERWCYVGDNPEKDFIAPNARGWTTVRVLRADAYHARRDPSPEGTPQHEIANLRELASVWPA
jgi:putative hydrolase of the HAD superfamily